MTVSNRVVENTVRYIKKYFFKPPSRSPLYWIILIEGIAIAIIFSPWVLGTDFLFLTMLGYQFIALGSAEVISTTPRMSGLLRAISVPFAIAVIILAVTDPIWSR